jgi:hypothetical protein
VKFNDLTVGGPECDNKLLSQCSDILLHNITVAQIQFNRDGLIHIDNHKINKSMTFNAGRVVGSAFMLGKDVELTFENEVKLNGCMFIGGRVHIKNALRINTIKFKNCEVIIDYADNVYCIETKDSTVAIKHCSYIDKLSKLAIGLTVERCDKC